MKYTKGHLFVSRRRAAVILLVILVIATLSASIMVGAGPVPGLDRPRGFTKASLKGYFASQSTGDGHVSTGFGVVIYDGLGNTTRRITVNAPAEGGGRRLLPFPGEGTYTMNPDGTGTATYTNRLADGSTSIVNFDFVITKADVVWPLSGPAVNVATEIYTVQREAGTTVSLVTAIERRVPE